jgi:hypothetical protein
MTLLTTIMLMMMLRGIDGFECNGVNTTALNSCSSDFMTCVSSGVMTLCWCLNSASGCANALLCDQAAAKVRSFLWSRHFLISVLQGLQWTHACDAEACDSCELANVQASCADTLDTADAAWDLCQKGANANSTFCSCVTDYNATLIAGEQLCGSSYGNKIAGLASFGGTFCGQDSSSLCTPYEVLQIGNWSDGYDTCLSPTTTDSVTQVGALCKCVQTFRQKVPQIKTSCAQLRFLNANLDLQWSLYNCADNINKSITCDTAKLATCSETLTGCQRATAADVCSCYAGWSNCLGSNAVCPIAVAAQAIIYKACKAVCPATTNCGMPGKTFVIPPFDMTTATTPTATTSTSASHAATRTDENKLGCLSKLAQCADTALVCVEQFETDFWKHTKEVCGCYGVAVVCIESLKQESECSNEIGKVLSSYQEGCTGLKCGSVCPAAAGSDGTGTVGITIDSASITAISFAASVVAVASLLRFITSVSKELN